MGNAAQTPARADNNPRTPVLDSDTQDGRVLPPNARPAGKRPSPHEQLAHLLGKPSRPPRDDRVAELCIRHHLGMYRDRPAVDRRLAELFQTNPPDVLDRLERAADHLGITGDDLERLGDMATARLADAPAGRQGDMPDGLITQPIKHPEGSDS